MKNLKKIFLLTLIAGAIYSCDDAYEIIQPGEYAEDVAILTLADMNLALSEVYDNISGEDIIGFTSVFTDEAAIGNENGGQNLDEYRFQVFANNGYASSIWLDNYRVINYANRLIEASDNVVLDTLADDFEDQLQEKTRILTEARVIRAFSHFQLLTYFSTDLKNDSALGVILMDHVPSSPPNLEQLPRSTNGELFAFIDQDLDYAQENFSTLANNGVVLIKPQFILGLRARIAAYRGLYPEALAYAQQTLDIVQGNGLVTGETLTAATTAYRGVWTDTNIVSEVIFTLTRPTGKTGIVGNWFFNGASLAGGPFLDMSRSLYNQLVENNDVRLRVFVDNSSLIAEDYTTVFDYKNADVIVIDKYPGNTAQNLPLNNNIKVMRFVEMHFIKAEAQVAAGDLAGALTTINFVREKRKATALPAFENAQQAWKAILDERRMELSFEGHRYIDLKRLGTLAGVPGVQRYTRDCTPYSSCDLPVTDYRFTLPIPLDELNGNAAIRSQQNPGY
ncbi:RagB/SusD family nutrient uptake outer membrane protein [Flavobacterium zepuense]|uniref:RagB/SusD family nutrient uptake outer membrane protein n=1 Tax=Flavobacterium zepuense TaxID=2593302 RepID=A0A552V3T4_9FLAO|nr:RagB/SusD family nutrient uptake outer membrane protein [Flavobacterium zepuense]TRW25122.1 RagB/SusD family nutrient uptake outer membrane protein [Flavobacterium zepuense]